MSVNKEPLVRGNIYPIILKNIRALFIRQLIKHSIVKRSMQNKFKDSKTMKIEA